MEYIDTHVHLWHDDFSGMLPSLINRAYKAGVSRFVVPGTNLATSKQAIKLAEQYEEIVPAVGLHPMEPSEPLDSFITLAERPEVKAIGEVGIDRRAGDWNKQEKRFRFFLELAIKTHKPVIMHLLNDWEPVLALVADYPELRGKVVWHCFTGDRVAVDKMTKLDMYISCTAILARKKMEATHRMIKDWPLNRLMLETDGPWLSWPGEKGPNQPITIPKLANLIATIKDVSVEKVAEKTTQAAIQFFDIEKSQSDRQKP